MEDFIIRNFEWDKDYGRVLEFQEDLYKTNFPDFIATYAFFKEIEKRLREVSDRENNRILVAEKNGRVIAYLWVEYQDEKGIRVGTINQLYIVPRWRNQGLGEILLHKGDDFFRENRVRKIQLHVSASNVAAYKLYKKSGFQPIRVFMEKDTSLD